MGRMGEREREREMEREREHELMSTHEHVHMHVNVLVGWRPCFVSSTISHHKLEHLPLNCARDRQKLETVAKPTTCSHKKLEDVLCHCNLVRDSARKPPPPASKSFFPRVLIKRDALWIKGVPAAKRGTPETLVIGLPHVVASTHRFVVLRGHCAQSEEHVSLMSFIKSQGVQWMNHMDHCGEIINDVFPVVRDDVLTQKCPKETRRHAGVQRPRPSVQPLIC